MSALNQRGAFLLTGVLVLSAVSLVISLVVVLGGVARTQSSGVSLANTQARGLGESCVEQALNDIRSNDTASGTTSYVNDDVVCTYQIIIGVNPLREIRATATRNNTEVKLRVRLSSTTPSIIISDWQEVASF